MKRILPVVLMVLVTVSLGGCATLLPPQTKPTSPEAFAGQYAGAWYSHAVSRSGGVDLTVGNPRDGVIDLWVKLTHSRFSSWQTVAQFVGGELVVDRPSLWMVLRLHGGDRLSAEYHNKITGNRGTWSLTRKAG